MKYLITCDDCGAWTTCRCEFDPDTNSAEAIDPPPSGKWESEPDEEWQHRHGGQCQHDDYTIGDPVDDEPEGSYGDYDRENHGPGA